jgi:hypothetical protein
MVWAGIATSTRAAALTCEVRLSMELDAVERLVGGSGEVGLWEVGSGSNLD